jgi:hypothetical protein
MYCAASPRATIILSSVAAAPLASAPLFGASFLDSGIVCQGKSVHNRY